MAMQSKINQLLQKLPKGTVILSSWLETEGYSYELQQRYRKSGWLSSIGKGAMIRTGDDFLLSGALTALQQQAKSTIHIGGRSALELSGKTHYLQLKAKEVTLFVDSQDRPPQWFRKINWDLTPKIFNTNLFLKPHVGMVEYSDKELKMQVSGDARALMECLWLTPTKFSLFEAKEIMEGLVSLRPAIVQELLENCKSVKVKRLFLFLAEMCKHTWFNYIDIHKINLGSGKRSLSAQGVFIPKYQIVVPKELI
jgi:hypothetical protein